jgi:hypothetical protein
VSQAKARVEASALPPDWAGAWAVASPGQVDPLESIRRGQEGLCRGIELVDRYNEFAELVHPRALDSVRLQSWYPYKEAFSSELPQRVFAELGAGTSQRVVDPFAGVATTQLALQHVASLDATLGIEYSPFAHFVGRVKICARSLDQSEVKVSIGRLVAERLEGDVPVPDLSSFANPRIFSPGTAGRLAELRVRIDQLIASDDTKDFLRLGLAAIIEPVSSAIKDGRALRIVGPGHRRRSRVREAVSNWSGDPVLDTAREQWLSMTADLDQLGPPAHVVMDHIHGDARELDNLTRAGLPAIPEASVGLIVGSPPYLNSLDYTEVYKLELWLLGFVSTQDSFTALRKGTLRSHPSIAFPSRSRPTTPVGRPVQATIEAISSFLECNHDRANIGRMVRDYFDDMSVVLEKSSVALEPGGHLVLVVANSTFSGRTADTGETGFSELWRLPILTDVLLARLGEAAGLEVRAIWAARTLRPRNVKNGSARESLVVFRKPRNR